MRKRKQRFEGLEYEPRNVKELLTEMKDTSEHMIDLAYSALLFDSEPMAYEVQTLEERMDHLLYQIRLSGTTIL